MPMPTMPRRSSMVEQAPASNSRHCRCRHERRCRDADACRAITSLRLPPRCRYVAMPALFASRCRRSPARGFCRRRAALMLPADACHARVRAALTKRRVMPHARSDAV